MEDAILNLRYGSVHVNTVTMLGIAFPSLVWGGHPGATVYDLQSGMGFVSHHTWSLLCTHQTTITSVRASQVPQLRYGSHRFLDVDA